MWDIETSFIYFYSLFIYLFLLTYRCYWIAYVPSVQIMKDFTLHKGVLASEEPKLFSDYFFFDLFLFL